MAIHAEDVRKLRELTGLGIMACKRALQEADGDPQKAAEILRKQGFETAMKTKGRATRCGRIGHYVHTNGKIGVILELSCETDFVANSDVFQSLLHDLCMQVAATSPRVVSRENLPADAYEKEENRPPDAESFYKQVCLLEQPFIKDPMIPVQDRINAALAQLKENIAVRRFARFEVGVDEG